MRAAVDASPSMDLFGFSPPAPMGRRKRKVLPGAENDYDTLAAAINDALERLSDEVTEAIANLQLEIVGLVDCDNAGQIDGLLETLDDDLTDLVRNVRRKVFE